MTKSVNLCFCILVAVLLMCTCWGVNEFYPFSFRFVDSLLDGNEYNRMEFQVSSAAKCRAVCKKDTRCKAVEFIHNYMDSGSHACVFYDDFSSTIDSVRAPSNKTTGIWVKP